MRGMPEDVRQVVARKGLRNVTLLTQVSTGTVGTMVGTSTGIEPFFYWSYFRKGRLGVHEEKVKVVQEWQANHPGEALPEDFVNAMQLLPQQRACPGSGSHPVLGRLGHLQDLQRAQQLHGGANPRFVMN